VGEGRDDEEEMAGLMLRELGYEVVEPPFKFEGFPELKWIDGAGLYLGGYGFRSDKRVYDWLRDQYGCKIIPIRETDPTLYHLDCQAFPIAQENVLLCTEIMDPSTVKEIGKVCNVIPVSKSDAYEGICNCLQCGMAIYNGSPLRYMKKDDPEYQAMKTKDENLESICSRLGLEITFFDLHELEKLGAKLSCLVTPLNVRF
jgi:N-dimethylarginine dimethylaminohydrolase